MFKLTQSVLLILLALLVAFSICGQASDRSYQIPSRGEVTGRIGGYEISGLRLNLAADPVLISTVEFDLNGQANQATVRFDVLKGQVFSCRNPFRSHWICELEGVGVEDVQELTIIAVGG
jgi:hypothetical protein